MDMTANTNRPEETTTMDAITTAFAEFEKWDTYGVAYRAIRTRAVTLAEVQKIGWDVAGIMPDVIKMRMTQFDKMNPRKILFSDRDDYDYKSFRFEG
jgi:hypothetical protein